MNSQQIALNLEAVISEYEDIIVNNSYGTPSHKVWEARSIILESIRLYAPKNSSFLREANYILKRAPVPYGQSAYARQDLKNDLTDLYGVLLGLNSAYQFGLLQSVEETIHIEIYGDFLSMANSMLEEDKRYKTPAAVMIGSVLEEHLRKLCVKNGISILKNKNGKNHPKSASTLNNELKSNSVYNQVQHSLVEAWIKIRNSAAHGKDDEFSYENTRLMHDGIETFLTQYPA